MVKCTKTRKWHVGSVGGHCTVDFLGQNLAETISMRTSGSNLTLNSKLYYINGVNS